jgi:hypothetical protein
MRQLWKAKVMCGTVATLLLKEEFDKDDNNFVMTMCANPQNIFEFAAYSEESAQRIAEFVAKEHQEGYRDCFTITYPHVLVSYSEVNR